jgi:hypothetical protein
MPRLQEEMDRISAAFEEGREQGRQERQTDIVEWLHRIDGGCDVIVYVAGIAKAIEVRDWKKSNDGAP